MNWLIHAQNFVTKKSQTQKRDPDLDFDFEHNRECYKVCTRLHQLLDIKSMKKH